METVHNNRKSLIYNYIRSTKHVSFTALKKFEWVHGDKCMSIDPTEESKRSNIIIAWEVSDEIVRIVNELVAEKRIHLDPCVPMVYALDGETSALPIAKKAPKNGYKDPHWLPVVINAYL